MAETIFSKILRGEIPAHKVYEDDHVLAFLDVGPVSHGHTLVIPKEEVATVGELSDEASAAIGRVLPRLCRAVAKASGTKDYNILQNNGAPAHQAVMHVHFHIIPKPNDIEGLGVRWPAGKLQSGEELAQKVTAALRADEKASVLKEKPASKKASPKTKAAPASSEAMKPDAKAKDATTKGAPKKSLVTIAYTDGACSGNPGPGGWAWAVEGGAYGSGADSDTTNQRMELTAAWEAVKSIEGQLLVVSDSTYVVNCFKNRWHVGWKKRGWRNSKNEPVANRDLWEPFIELVLSRKDVQFQWVKGHSGHPMNDLVDRLAVEAGQRGAGVSGDDSSEA
jgi:ribonuclease HI